LAHSEENLKTIMLKKILLAISRIIEVLVLAVFIYVILNYRLVVYGVDQLKGQLSIVWNAKPIGEVMADPAFPDSLKKQLLLIEDIKKFAINCWGYPRQKIIQHFTISMGNHC
jgi:predicted aminopeptidase